MEQLGTSCRIESRPYWATMILTASSIAALNLRSAMFIVDCERLQPMRLIKFLEEGIYCD